MKVEDIKLAFESNIQFSLVDDINSLYAKAFSLYDVQSPLIKAQTVVKSSIPLFNDAVKASEKGLDFAKQLGDSSLISLFQKKITDNKEMVARANKISGLIDNIISAI